MTTTVDGIEISIRADGVLVGRNVGADTVDVYRVAGTVESLAPGESAELASGDVVGSWTRGPVRAVSKLGPALELTEYATSLVQWGERLKALLDEPDACRCRVCSGPLHASHGLAGGGSGPQLVCSACGFVVLKYFEGATRVVQLEQPMHMIVMEGELDVSPRGGDT